MTNDQLEALVTAQLVAGAIKYGEDSRVSNYVLDHSRNTARDIMAPLRDAEKARLGERDEQEPAAMYGDCINSDDDDVCPRGASCSWMRHWQKRVAECVRLREALSDADKLNGKLVDDAELGRLVRELGERGYWLSIPWTDISGRKRGWGYGDNDGEDLAELDANDPLEAARAAAKELGIETGGG